MNGAAMNCRQDPGLRPQHRDPSSLHNPGYHLQINRQQNLQPQNSKTLNYPSFSSNYQVDGYYDNLHQYENIVDSRHSDREVDDPRFQRPKAVKRRYEPIDLPVPQFEIDEHSVSDLINANDVLIQGSKGLDLDTRIGLLIKSKALAGVHPIFSDLNDSEESQSDLDDPFLSRPRSKFRKENREMPYVQREMEIPIRESFDDPEKPLSRPPSPFLSRATYLFWFNKAIEIKQQAKAQEQALLEQAARKMIQDTSPSLRNIQDTSPSLNKMIQDSPSLKINQPDKPQKRPIPKNLMDEISKELKEVIKQEFIREVIEQTAFNTLDDWWEKQNQEEKRDESEKVNIISNKRNERHQDSLIGNSECQGSTSPKLPFPWKKDIKHQENLQDEDDLKLTCHDEKISVNKALREIDYTHSDNSDRAMILRNSATQENKEPWVEETSGEDLKKRFEMKGHEVSSMKCYRDRSNTCESEVKKSEMSQLLPANVASSVDGIVDEKFAIVKDILDFIVNEVNTIVVQRYDNIPHQEVNENLACTTYSNVAISMDSLLTDNVTLDPSEDIANVGL